MQYRMLVLLLVVTALPANARADSPGPDATAAEIEKAASDEFSDGYKKLQDQYKKEVAKAILKASRIEILLVDYSKVSESNRDSKEVDEAANGDDSFMLGNLKSTKQRDLTADELKQLRPLLARTVVAKPSGSFCHWPIHGLRVFDGDELIFEGTFCYRCQNCYMLLPNGQPLDIELTSDEFVARMKALMPIPELILKEQPETKEEG